MAFCKSSKGLSSLRILKFPPGADGLALAEEAKGGLAPWGRAHPSVISNVHDFTIISECHRRHQGVPGGGPRPRRPQHLERQDCLLAPRRRHHHQEALPTGPRERRAHHQGASCDPLLETSKPISFKPPPRTFQVRLDREERDEYTLILTASDLGSPPQQTSRLLKVVVKDIDDHQPTFNRQRVSTTLAQTRVLFPYGMICTFTTTKSYQITLGLSIRLRESQTVHMCVGWGGEITQPV